MGPKSGSLISDIGKKPLLNDMGESANDILHEAWQACFEAFYSEISLIYIKIGINFFYIFPQKIQ